MTETFVKAAEAAKTAKARSAANAFARAVLQEQRIVTDRGKNSYRYNGQHWEEAPEQWLLRLALEQAGQHSGHKTRQEMVNYIRAHTYDDTLRWGRVADHEVPFANGVLDVLTGRLRAHEPADNLERIIPWHYRPAAECPIWMGALDDWLGSEEQGLELIGALQEYFGYLLFQHAKWKKALVFKGPSDSGKSVPLFVAIQLVGRRFTCQLSVEHMDDPERRSVIKGMALNVMSEISNDALVADGGFKTLVSTEEPIMISAKFKPTEIYLPTAKHIISTNTLPTVNDSTAATFNRMLIIPFDKVIPRDRQDRTLQDKLLAEMEGIVVWAVEGAKRLALRGGVWPEPARSREIVDEYRASENAARTFMEECWREDPGARVPLSKAAERYNEWNRGARQRMDHRKLTKLLRDAGYPVSRQRVDDGRIVTCLLDHSFVALPQEMAGTGQARGGTGGATGGPAGEPPPHEGDGR